MTKAKYKYGRRILPGCEHIWGDPVGQDGTQFCQNCGGWRVLRELPKKAKSITLPDGTIEIYDASGERTAVIV